MLQDKHEALGRRIILDYFTFANLTVLSRTPWAKFKDQTRVFHKKKNPDWIGTAALISHPWAWAGIVSLQPGAQKPLWALYPLH